MSYLSVISSSKTLKLSKFKPFSFNLFIHLLFIIIVEFSFKLCICFSKLSALKASTISTYFVRNFSSLSEIFTSKKFTHHFILDSYSISVIKS